MSTKRTCAAFAFKEAGRVEPKFGACGATGYAIICGQKEIAK